MLALPLIFFLPLSDIESGALSTYHPGDGHNAGTLSCGGRFNWKQRHIAYRKWRRVGCGRRVLVIAHRTGRAAITTVRDAGPFGIISRGRRRVYTGSTMAPKGWRWRGLADLSWALWVDLGRPPFLSRITLIWLPRQPRPSS
jgi:hypothetical protein